MNVTITAVEGCRHLDNRLKSLSGRFLIMIKRLLSAAILAILLVVPFLSGQAKAFQLLSHRAVYDLSLARGGDGKINHADGRLVIEWADTCDGYTTEQRMLMRLGVDKGTVRSDFQFSSWESKDGNQFRYDVKSIFGNEKPEVFRGRAKRSNNAGLATFSKPADLKMELPEKIVFPSEHMARMIDQALSGERQIAMKMFDGTGEEGLLEAVAFVLGPAPKVTDGLLKAYANVPGWRIQLSFFDFKSRDQMPIYKIIFTLYSNGIAGDLVMDYSNFAVRGKLSNLKVLPSLGC
jgi:hypothetical protein